MNFFLEDDDELERIGNDYKSGKMLTGEIKAILINLLQKIIGEIQEKSKNITDDEIKY